MRSLAFSRVGAFFISLLALVKNSEKQAFPNKNATTFATTFQPISRLVDRFFVVGFKDVEVMFLRGIQRVS